MGTIVSLSLPLDGISRSGGTTRATAASVIALSLGASAQVIGPPSVSETDGESAEAVELRWIMPQSGLLAALFSPVVLVPRLISPATWGRIARGAPALRN